MNLWDQIESRETCCCGCCGVRAGSVVITSVSITLSVISVVTFAVVLALQESGEYRGYIYYYFPLTVMVVGCLIWSVLDLIVAGQVSLLLLIFILLQY